MAALARRADFIYPNPYQADPKTFRIPPADEQTWLMAQEAIATSYNSKRKLDREGLVLHESYASTPWLVYSKENIPWHRSELVNGFAKHYLGYGQQKDREFIVRAQFSIKTLVEYWLRGKGKNERLS